MRVSLVLLGLAFASFFSYMGGHIDGSRHGAKQLHRGVFACMTLPNNEVTCWRVKK